MIRFVFSFVLVMVAVGLYGCMEAEQQTYSSPNTVWDDDYNMPFPDWINDPDRVDERLAWEIEHKIITWRSDPNDLGNLSRYWLIEHGDYYLDWKLYWSRCSPGWLESSDYQFGDFNGDNKTDLNDFAILARYWKGID